MNYFKQIYYEMRHHKMMTWVSISGTALSIFLVMALFMANQVKTIEHAPDSNRSRIMFGYNMEVRTEQMTSAGSGLSGHSVERVYQNLDGVELMSSLSSRDGNADVNAPDGDFTTVSTLRADGNFWKMYDFSFISGTPFSQNDADAEAMVAVIQEDLARKLYGTVDAAGMAIEIDRVPYKVVGVVRKVNPILTDVFAGIYLPFKHNPANDQMVYQGDQKVRLLLKPGVSPSYIKEQVSRRYKAIQDEAAKEGNEVVYHQQPYTSEELALGEVWANTDPDMRKKKVQDSIFYALLLLIPAINLSSMTRTRLRRRVGEIGVRRAFGAKKFNILTQIFGENLIITLIGGIIGLLFSVVFVSLLSDMFFQFGSKWSDVPELVGARPDFSMLFRWQSFVIAFVACFILNVLSASLPAWKASKTNPAEALSSH